jgi:hypothetical protein
MTTTPIALLTFRQFSLKHRAFSEPSLRWTRFKEEESGFAPAFVRVGRRVLIDEARFFQIIREQNGAGEGASDGT